ncbi:hypothetical protein Q7C36_002859 [Tachysurus vachellii]|uniref:Uncharacterized protein n=1 Tax=Tachysurus vachellii TaxID=175792 RepID=A0AA88NYR3_TACVA|nr:hypothetical protein Q7C36_002859 [Tachysurus vachellii]
MESKSTRQLKSWVRKELKDLRCEMSKEIQGKITNVCLELAECVRLQTDQIYTLLQMKADTREMAIENLLNKKTSEVVGDLLLCADRTKTAEERKKAEDEDLLLLETKKGKDERPSRTMNQDMDAVSEEGEEEMKREKERQVVEQNKGTEKRKRLWEEKMKEGKGMLKEKRREDMIKEEKRELSHLFQDRAMASDLELLTFDFSQHGRGQVNKTPSDLMAGGQQKHSRSQRALA